MTRLAIVPPHATAVCPSCHQAKPRHELHSRIVHGSLFHRTEAGNVTHVWCSKCQGDRNRSVVDRTAELVRELKQGSTPDVERHITKQLMELGHPDVQGLVMAIAQRRAAEPARGRRVTRGDV